MSLEMQREIARRNYASTEREQESVKAGMASDMEALKLLASTPAPGASGKEGGGIMKKSATPSIKTGAPSPRIGPSSSSLNVKSATDSIRKGSVSPGANMPPSALKSQPVPRASFTDVSRRPSATISSTAAGGASERRGSFNIKAKQSIYIGGGGDAAAGGDGDGATMLAVDDPQVVEMIAKLRAEVAEVTKERDWLNKERQLWMTRIETDNTRLASMLRNVRDAKKRLIDEMDSVQAEKAKLKSMQLQLQHNELKSTTYPLSEEDCVIGAHRRELMAPQSRQDAAKALHERLLSLVSKTHANMADVNTLVSAKVDEAIKSFIDFRPELTERCVEALANIANTAPGNLKDTEAAAASISEAMVGALLGKSAAVLKVRAEKAGFNAAEAKAQEFESKDLESKTLKEQNETLKVSLAQMRKKYTTLLEKATSKAKETETKAAFEEKSKKTVSAGPAPSRGYVAGDYVPTNLPPAAPVNVFEVLPFEIKQVANTLTSEYIQRIAEDNPLSDNIKAYLLKEAISEVSVQQQAPIGLILHSYKENGLIAFDGSMKDEQLQDIIRTALRTPAFTKQATINMHLILSYLFQRQRVHDPSGGKTHTGFAGDVGEGAKNFESTETKDSEYNSKSSAGAGKLTLGSKKSKQPEAQEYFGSDNRNFVGGEKKKKEANNVFLASTGAEEVMTLRPPDETADDKKKKVPSFMQAVPKKKINRD